jgi:hypothetical protein
MSDCGFVVLRQLKQKRHKDMAKYYCQHFVDNIMKKHDKDKT